MKNTALLLALIALLYACQDKTGMQTSIPEEEAVSLPSKIGMAFNTALESGQLKQFLQDSSFVHTQTRIEEFYAVNPSPVWVDDQGISENGKALLSIVNNCNGYGLDSSILPFETISPLMVSIEEEASKMELEMVLTKTYFMLATYLGRGAVSKEILPIFEIDSLLTDLPSYLSDAIENQRIVESLEHFEPTLPEYKQLRKALTEYTLTYPITTAKMEVTDFKTDSVKSLKQSREALILHGYLDTISAQDDSAFIEQLKLFQKHNGLNEDGKPGKYTARALSTSNRERYKKAVVALHKMRWNKEQDRKTYFYVNIPSYRMCIMENGKPVKEHRAVVGKSWTQTNELKGEMEYFILNPRWHVPYSISSTELLTKAKNDPTYLKRNGYLISDAGKTLTSSEIDWNKVSSDNFKYNISQNSGRGNALGQVKFIFPNGHNIYFHDTPSRRLFDNDIRAYSHGCVRLHNPLELAKYLATKQTLSVHKDSIQSLVDSQKNRKVILKEKIPVFIEYYTAGTALDGTIQFYLDVYKKDVKLSHQLFHQELYASIK